MRRYVQLAAALLLLAAVLLQHPPPAAADAALDEATIMHRLRQAANEAGLSAWPLALHPAGLVRQEQAQGVGWELSDPTHHCYWQRITCDSDGKVMQILWMGHITLNDTLLPPSRASLLLPELAQLLHLRTLRLELDSAQPGLPREWGQAGAFPSLQTLVLSFPYLSAAKPLPPVEPGALPRLEQLNLLMEWQDKPVPLPASWGSQGALPELRELVLVTAVQLPLPASWAQGFPKLTELYVTGKAWNARVRDYSAAAAFSQTAHPLPSEWAGGFSQLEKLTLAGIGLGGTFPAAWQANGSFPRLRKLNLEVNQLAGPLPAHLLCNHPLLENLRMGHNQLTGPLPDQWATCQNQLDELHLDANQLTGPALPPAWLAPNSTLDLAILSLATNPGLEGTLPAALNWSRLAAIFLTDTGVRGGIPAQWCTAAFAQTIRIILINAVYQPGFLESLPPCASHSMPTFMQGAAEVEGSAVLLHPALNGTAAGGRLHSGSMGRLLLTLSLLAAVAAAAAAAWYRRRQRSRAAGGWTQSQQQRHGEKAPDEEEIELLSRHPHALHDAGMRQRRAALAPELLPARARLKALAQRQLGGSALQSGRPEAELLSLLKGLEHALAPLSVRDGTGLPNSRASMVPHASKASVTSNGAGSTQVQLLQGWGLPTDSLRVQAADLQFVAEPDGTLVQLGEGAHGVVYLAKMHLDTYVAVKVFGVQQGVQSEAFWREVALLQRCVHPRIVPVYGVAVQGHLLMVAMQLMLGGSLRAALINPACQDALRWNNCGLQIALDVAEAVAYLHEEARILHSDVKSANVLLSLDWRAALTDLGVAQVMEHTARTAVGGSNLYAAPEQLLGERCTLAADVYCLGLLLIELTTRQIIVKRGQWELPKVPDDCPQGVADLIDQCLSSDPRQRPTAAEVLRRLRDSGGDSGGGTEASE